MSQGTEILRQMHHTDAEHAARVDAYDAGWRHANYVNSYGPTSDTEMPDRFGDVADVWREGYEEGQDAFLVTEDDEAMQGFDWREEQ